MNQSRHDGEGPKNGLPGRTRPNLLGATTTTGAQGAAASALGEYRILAEFDGSAARRPRAAARAPWGALALAGLVVLAAALGWSTWSARKAAPSALAIAKPVTVAVPAARGEAAKSATAAISSVTTTSTTAALTLSPKPEGSAPIETVVAPMADPVVPAAVDKPAAAAPATASPPPTNRVAQTRPVVAKDADKSPGKPAGAQKTLAAPAATAAPATKAATAAVTPNATKPVPNMAPASNDKTALAAAAPTESLKQLPPPASSTRVQPDPDEDLIAALISHLSRAKGGTAAPQAPAAPRPEAGRTASTAAAAPAGVIDQLARCVATGQSTTDCRARLCEGRWGKDVACPQPLPARP